MDMEQFRSLRWILLVIRMQCEERVIYDEDVFFNKTNNLVSMKNRFLYLSLAISVATCLSAQNKLSTFDKEGVTVQGDWLVDPVNAKADVFQTPEGHLVFTNGLVNRTFTLQPNVASIGLDEMRNNTSYLRSIRPEASVEIDGFHFDVGGLIGQPVHNYLLKEWISDLKADPGTFKIVDYKIEPIKARFDWMKKQAWMPKDMPWPAPGKELIFTYRLNDEAIKILAEQSNKDDRRPVLLSDDFKKLSSDWKLTESKSHQRNSFINEGKVGEIMALANTAVYAEREFAKGTKVVMATVTPGTDRSSSWGPGLALVFKDKTVKINVRGGEHKIGFYDGKNDTGGINMGDVQTVLLKMELKEGRLEASASVDGGKEWKPVGTCSLSVGETPQKVRIGKMDAEGGNKDFAEKGTEGRCRIESFCMLGGLSGMSAQEAFTRLAYLKQVEVEVHYELYDNMPVFSKWLTVNNNSGREITIDHFKSEILAATEPESAVDFRERWLYPNITVDTDYNFGGMSEEYIYSSSVAWKPDPLYKTQVNYDRTTPCLLEVAPKIGPDQQVQPGRSFSSFRVWELLNDSWDRERKSLGYRRMMRAIAPWVTENPILMHVRSSDNASVKKAIDQCAEIGFEMVIMTFWSGFEAEDNSPENLARMKKLADYACSKNIALGGYSLLASRHIDKENDVVLPKGQSARFGNSPCVESKWGQEYMDKLYHLYGTTGLNVFEHDGSYPGDVCYSTTHPGHKGVKDSQWNQFKRVADFYKWCRSKGIYLNVPDLYFLNGSNKVGMGYREANWSLPREQQEIVERQNVFDGTWNKTPSMGWMFVPLVEYQGGGEAATIEPLKDHLPHYGQRLANLFGAGVQACYRGPQLYDSPQTKEVVMKWVKFYKKHRDVLDSDLIHIRRPDGRDYDAILHVNPQGEEKGLLMVYNPLNEPVKRKLRINLYYTGLKDVAMVSEQDGKAVKMKIDHNYDTFFEVEIPAKSQTWYVIK